MAVVVAIPGLCLGGGAAAVLALLAQGCVYSASTQLRHVILRVSTSHNYDGGARPLLGASSLSKCIYRQFPVAPPISVKLFAPHRPNYMSAPRGAD